MKVFYKLDGSSGEYPATYNFLDDVVGGQPAGWTVSREGGEDGTVQIIALLGAHRKVLELDDTGTGRSEIYNDFSAQDYGTIELYVSCSDETFIANIVITDTSSTCFRLGIDADFFRYNDGAWHNIAVTKGDDVIYHIRIDFECTAGGYEGLAQYNWRVYIDGVLYGDYDFDAEVKPQRLMLRTGAADLGYKWNVDAVGYSWDEDYAIGDNLNGAWFECAELMESPVVDKRIGATSVCNVKIWDFEGEKYPIWYIRDFTPMRITDDDGVIIFSGYLINKRHISSAKEQYYSLTLEGFSKALNWTPNDINYILEEGKISGFQYDLPNHTIALNGFNNTAQCICTDGTNFYITNGGGNWIYKYNANLVYVTRYDVSAKSGNPFGICWNGSFFYIMSHDNDRVDKYNSAFVWQSTVKSGLTSAQGGIAYNVHNSQFYLCDNDGTEVKIYDSAWTLLDTIDVLYFTHGIDCYANRIYTSNLVTGKIVIYNDDLSEELDSFTLAAARGICVGSDGTNEFLYTCKFNSNCYIYYAGGISLDDDKTIEVTDIDDNFFDWDPDANKWILDNDVGLLVNNLPDSVDTVSFAPNAVTSMTGGTLMAGDINSLDVAQDGDLYIVKEVGFCDSQTVIELTNAGIPNTNDLRTLRIKYRYALAKYQGLGALNGKIYILKNNGEVLKIKDFIFAGTIPKQYTSGEILLKRDEGYDLTEFVEENGGNYDTIYIKFILYSDYSNVWSKIYLDYLEVEVEYDDIETSPVMEKIVGCYGDGVTSWIACNYDFEASRLGVGATFKIGENINKILTDLFSNAGIPFVANSSFLKYMARTFVGNNNMSALKAVCELEGAYWVENHINERIEIAVEDDFEDSELSFTQSNYDHDWEIEDECNHVKAVRVYGADSSITGSAVDINNNTSKIIKQITDSNINTVSEAQEIADTQLAILKTKRPSIKIVLNYALYTLEPMQTVNLTFARPTIDAADYVVRKVVVEHLGYDKDDNEIMRTTLYCGLGASPILEKLDNLLRGFEEKIQKLKANTYND